MKISNFLLRNKYIWLCVFQFMLTYLNRVCCYQVSVYSFLLIHYWPKSGLAFCRQKPVSAAQMAETGIKYFLPAETWFLPANMAETGKKLNH